MNVYAYEHTQWHLAWWIICEVLNIFTEYDMYLDRYDCEILYLWIWLSIELSSFNFGFSLLYQGFIAFSSEYILVLPLPLIFQLIRSIISIWWEGVDLKHLKFIIWTEILKVVQAKLTALESILSEFIRWLIP